MKWEKRKADVGYDIVDEYGNTIVGDCGIENESDATMIAAVPDLLAAIEKTLSGVKGWQTVLADAYKKAGMEI